jgi:hypothetical protein
MAPKAGQRYNLGSEEARPRAAAQKPQCLVAGLGQHALGQRGDVGHGGTVTDPIPRETRRFGRRGRLVAAP